MSPYECGAAYRGVQVAPPAGRRDGTFRWRGSCRRAPAQWSAIPDGCLSVLEPARVELSTLAAAPPRTSQYCKVNALVTYRATVFCHVLY